MPANTPPTASEKEAEDLPYHELPGGTQHPGTTATDTLTPLPSVEHFTTPGALQISASSVRQPVTSQQGILKRLRHAIDQEMKAYALDQKYLALRKPTKREILKEHLVNASEDCLGTAVWLLVSYAQNTFVSDDGTDKIRGYILLSFLEGLTSNLKAALIGFGVGYTESRGQRVPFRLYEHIFEAIKYIGIYILIDGGYQILADLVIALGKAASGLPFVLELLVQNPNFSGPEILIALGMFTTIVGTLYYKMSQLAEYLLTHFNLPHKKNDTTKFDALIVALKYFVFYLTDWAFGPTLFNITNDWVYLGCSSATVGVFSFGSAVLTDRDLMCPKQEEDPNDAYAQLHNEACLEAGGVNLSVYPKKWAPFQLMELKEGYYRQFKPAIQPVQSDNGQCSGNAKKVSFNTRLL